MKNKRILLIAYYYEPVNNAGIQRVKNFVFYLPKFGYDVDVITVGEKDCIEKHSYFKIFRFKDIYESLHNSNNIIVKIFCKLFFDITRILGILLDYHFFWKINVLNNINKIIDDNKYSFVMASFPPISNLQIGLEISRKYKIPFVADYRDGLLYEPFKWVTNKGILYYNMCKLLEQNVAKHSCFQISVTQNCVNYFNNHYPNSKNLLIENGFNNEEMIAEKPIDFPNGFNVLFTGSIKLGGEKYYDGLYEVVLHNLFVDNLNVNFCFVGNFTSSENKFFKKYNNVFNYGKVSRECSIASQRKSDAILLITNDRPSSTHGKLYEYIFSNKPIINIGGDTNAKRIIKSTNSGKTFNYNDIYEIKNFISSIKKGEFPFERNNIEIYTRRYQNQLLASELNNFI